MSYISKAQNTTGIVLLPPCTASPSQFSFRWDCIFPQKEKGIVWAVLKHLSRCQRRLLNHVDKPAQLQVDNLLLLSNNSPSVLSFSHSTTALVEITEHIFTAIKIGQGYISGFQESFWQPTMILYVISCQHTVYHLTLSLGLGQSCQIANKILLLEALNLLFSLVLLGSMRHSPWPVIGYAVFKWPTTWMCKINMKNKAYIYVDNVASRCCSHISKRSVKHQGRTTYGYGFKSTHIKCCRSSLLSNIEL